MSVVLVTFNSADVIARALTSIPQGPEVIVVDNASTDDSLRIAEKNGARCIRSEVNLGYGAACNLGAAESRGDYILFLNPDAILLNDALDKLLSTVDDNPGACAAGPKFVDGAGGGTWRFQSILHPLKKGIVYPPAEPEGNCCLPLLTGAAILCRRDAFETAGGFDENIFLYYEDDDICRRLTSAGHSLIYVPEAEVYHEFGRSSGGARHIIRFKHEKKLLSRAYVMQKYGLPFDFHAEKRKALQRLVFATVKFDHNRRAAALGNLDALRKLSRP
ncbi:glycosyl transferase family 2 [Parvibaculum lavamentivorans DS-1]|uniref:Glycosyl transferase family 2 n=1 Tax=Parvibaculum lavamentivorans (strain DS-1 / DSM 13023 / NCIMB 13966) TaxID=402881 RepID=A7HYG5_PARL1|nr:glycosyl transferase family 2 [Parvibaculum lavamentivorans DS-1]